MLEIAIVENETIYSEHLKALIEKWADGIVETGLSVFGNGLEFFRAQETKQINKYDIIFLAIQLKYLDGIGVARQLRDIGFKNTIVFTTNYVGRAVDGYSVGAYRYYIKPIQFRDVKECMNYVMEKSCSEYFQYKYRGTLFRIPFAEIICFESMNHYVDIFTQEEIVKIKGVLKDIQSQCPTYFLRCQRSYIVNTDFIKARKGNDLILMNDKVVEISPRLSKIVNKIIENY